MTDGSSCHAIPNEVRHGFPPVAAVAAKHYKDLKKHDCVILINAAIDHLQHLQEERIHFHSPDSDRCGVPEKDTLGAAQTDTLGAVETDALGAEETDSLDAVEANTGSEFIHVPQALLGLNQEPGLSHTGESFHLS